MFSTEKVMVHSFIALIVLAISASSAQATLPCRTYSVRFTYVDFAQSQMTRNGGAATVSQKRSYEGSVINESTLVATFMFRNSLTYDPSQELLYLPPAALDPRQFNNCMAAAEYAALNGKGFVIEGCGYLSSARTSATTQKVRYDFLFMNRCIYY